MASQHLLAILLLPLLLLASQSGATDYSCSLDTASSYQPPNSCGSKSNSKGGSSSNKAGSSSNKGSGSGSSHNVSERLRYAEVSDSAPPPAAPNVHPPPPCDPSPPSVQLLKCCLKFEYVYSEYLSRGVYGFGLDAEDSSLGTGTVQGGHRVLISEPTLGMLDSMAKTSITNIRAIKDTLGTDDSEPDIDIRKSTFTYTFDKAVGFTSWPTFDVYKNENHFLLGSYLFVGILTKCYVGILDRMEGPAAKRLAGSLAAAKAEQEAATRSMLYQRMHQPVTPYRTTVLDMTNKISQYRDQLLNVSGVSDEGIFVPKCISSGAHGGNLFSVDAYGLPFSLQVDASCSVANVLKDFVN